MSQKGRHLWTVDKIISGGQTGADRAALDWAIKHQIPHGGWCPKGRLADENDPIDEKYRLTETPLPDYTQRTEWNVRDSDGTVIFSIEPYLTGGTQKTQDFCIQRHKPHLHIYKQMIDINKSSILLEFLYKHQIHILNVAGPRTSEESEISSFVTEELEKVWREITSSA